MITAVTSQTDTTSQPTKVRAVADDILEATMLTSYFAGDDTTLAKYTCRAMRFKASGTLEGGDLAFEYKFPDGKKGQYKLMAGTFSTRTGFQAAAFEKTITETDGSQHHSVKLLFPGTAMRSQFSDLNAFDTFWMKRLGSQIHNTKEWMDAEVLPRLHRDMKIEICGHCLGTQNALWAKAYLEEEKGMNVTSASLLEPTAAGLVMDHIVSDIKRMHAVDTKTAMKDVYKNTYTVLVDPPTVVNPFGFGNMWDTSSVGEKAYTLHVPATNLNEELRKVILHPIKFRREYRQQLESVRTAAAEKEKRGANKGESHGENENGEQAHDGTNGNGANGHDAVGRRMIRHAPSSIATNGNGHTHHHHGLHTVPYHHDHHDHSQHEKDPDKVLRAKAFFATPFGQKLGQQFFKNHYLLSMTSQILNPKLKLDEVITETHTPDAAAMAAHRPPSIDRGALGYLRQTMMASTIDTGRDLAAVLTTFCLRGGRTGTPDMAEPNYIWNTTDIQTMDDTLPKKGEEPNYPRNFFRNVTETRTRLLLDGLNAIIAQLPECSERRLDLEDIASLLVQTIAPGQQALPPQGIAMPMSELQARAIARHIPELHDILTEMAMSDVVLEASATRALNTLADLDKNLQRAYNIKHDEEIARFR